MVCDLGVCILKSIRLDRGFALKCIEWLLQNQETDELSEGTSIHKNGKGLNKVDAEFLHGKTLCGLHDNDLKRIASNYAHSQLAQAVRVRELSLPDSVDEEEDSDDDVQKITKRRRKIIESDDEIDEMSENEEDDPVKVDEYGIHTNGVVFPSNEFCSKVAAVVNSLREREERPSRFASRVRQIVNSENAWRGSTVSARVIDYAMFRVMPKADLYDNPSGLIRIFWASENRWVTAEARGVRRVSDTKASVELFFPDEGVEGTVSGPDAFYAYRLV
jgi:hypothetical protein